MGQKLSCVSKKKQQPENDITKPKKTKGKLGKKVVVKEVVEERVKPVEVASTNAAAPTAADQVQTEAVPETAIRRKPKLVILKPAPANAQIPTPLAPIVTGIGEDVKPPLDKATFAKMRKMEAAAGEKIHTSQPVDQASRELAQAEARPATWKDLYWALIGQRNFQTDEEKIKAIFSWLCSIPLDQDAFVTMEELDQGVKEGIEYAKEARKAKSETPNPDSPEVVVNDLTRGKSTYLRAFESLCRYSNIPCCTVKGLAKGVDYTVGMKLVDQTPIDGENSSLTRLHHAWSAAYIDGKWALFDSMWAAERLAMSANVRLSQIAQASRMDYETDMFYFNADPAKFIYSHYPFNEQWQLLNPPMSFKEFQDSVLLKPAFFTYGLGLFSHQEGVIQVQDKLIVKLSIPRSLINVLLFTFNLKLDGRDDMFEGVNLSRFGMHEISRKESSVTFSFRFPKSGAYKLTIYARKVGDPLFTDICEYRVEVKSPEPEAGDAKSHGSVNLPPFPPTSQSNYGPTEKATELKIRTVIPDLEAKCKCPSGVFEIRFTTVEPGAPLPKLTARLKSLLYDAAVLIDCLVIRTAEAPTVTTLASVKSQGSAVTLGAPAIAMVVITAYLPAAGEYALEVYGAPPDADENASYFLVWQLLIDADTGVKLSTPVRKRLATADLGPKDDTWNKLGLRTVSHSDPLIQVPTVALAGMRKTRSKSELIQQYVAQAERKERLEKEQQQQQKDESAEDVQVNDSLSVSPTVEADSKSNVAEEAPGPRSCDLQIVLEKPAKKHLCIVGQLVDISEEQEEDRTTYLLQQIEELDEAEASVRSHETITYLIRIPKADHFYKFYLYAAPVEASMAMSLPLVYTYLIEAPQRLMASEVPYIGVTCGPFPEKLEQKQQQEEGQKQLANGQ